ncbi:hypothetical protein JCM33374_g6128 [Metschnikowia sp. JCM 33374]|nr:hypothetical protein JCM33374_g6128 [Metschnikowia sp. JCM 33374]
MSALPSSRKTHSEKHKQIFRQLLKELPNKTCVDCKTAQHPRWASWNLGCFICIRCSGIHRSMGTHISRVKSVDLDVWTDEQVESMIKWGNDKCNQFWEAKLPDNYVPDASKIENFIRTKYDMKKWAASSRVPDPMSISAGSSAVRAEAVSGPPSGVVAGPKNPQLIPGSHNTRAPTAARVPAPVSRHHKPVAASAPSLLDDDFGAFTSSTPDLSSASSTVKPNRSATSVPTAHTPASATRASAPQPAIPSVTQPASPATPVASASAAPSPRVNDVRNDLKKSILSLYSSPSSSTSSVHQQQHQNFQQPQTHTFRSPAASSSPYTQQQSATPRTVNPQISSSSSSSVSGLSDSLLGLSFGNEHVSTSNGGSRNSSATAFVSTPQPSVRTQSPIKTKTATPTNLSSSASASASAAPSSTPQWANEWNDSSSSVNQWASAPAYNGTSAGASVLGAGFSGTFGNSGSTEAFNSTGLKSAATTTDLDDELFKNVWG